MSSELSTEFINSALNRLCEREGVHCLFAVESGSRAWGFASPDSDYDVRFVYLRPQADYLRIERPRDVIEQMTSDNLDMVGWDAVKALKLLGKSNPSIVEWLATPSMYQKDARAYAILTAAARECFSAKALTLHYISLGSDHWAKYVAGKSAIAPKRYFYAMRAVLSARYVMDKGKQSPILFSELLAASDVPGSIRQTIDHLLVLKKRGGEKEEIPLIAELDQYISSELAALTAKARALPPTARHQDAIENTFSELLHLPG